MKKRTLKNSGSLSAISVLKTNIVTPSSKSSKTLFRNLQTGSIPKFKFEEFKNSFQFLDIESEVNEEIKNSDEINKAILQKTNQHSFANKKGLMI